MRVVVRALLVMAAAAEQVAMPNMGAAEAAAMSAQPILQAVQAVILCTEAAAAEQAAARLVRPLPAEQVAAAVVLAAAQAARILGGTEALATMVAL